jgi:hypothetical protein
VCFTVIKSDLDTANDNNPEYICKLVDTAPKAGSVLDTILELPPEQIAFVIGDREKIAATGAGKLHFRDQEEFNAWYEAKKNKEQS